MVRKAPTLHWQTLEYEVRHRSADWFWAVGIITISGAVTAIIFRNILFALIILIGGFVLSFYAARPPREIDVVLSEEGILVEKFFYPYASLESFWVEEMHQRSRILIKSQKVMMPLIVVPINTQQVDSDNVHEYLSHYLPEEFQSESIFHRIMEYLGF